MRERLAAEFSAELSLRIGVETGEVVSGTARAGSSFVSGDAVNVAARLEQSAAPGQVLVGHRTAALVRGAFEFGPPIRLEVKGKRASVVAHELVGRQPETRSRRPGALGSTFVGRKAELAELAAAWDRVVVDQEAHLVLVAGDPGIGKTLLVEHALAAIRTRSPRATILIGRCPAYGKGLTYWPLAEVLREQLALGPDARGPQVLERLEGREILGLTFGLAVAGDVHPLAARERFHDAWVELLEELAAGAPLALVVEDLHWAEEPLLELVDDLAREVRARVLIIATARPEHAEARPATRGRGRSSTIWLEPLSWEDATSMVADLLGGGAAPAAFRELVVERAEGNPFFLEELLESLVDRGLLHARGMRWELTGSATVDVPDSVRGVIAARMDLLGPTEKAALQAAAVAGRVFRSAALVDLLDGVEPDFATLEDRAFLRRLARAKSDAREYTSSTRSRGMSRMRACRSGNARISTQRSPNSWRSAARQVISLRRFSRTTTSRRHGPTTRIWRGRTTPRAGPCSQTVQSSGWHGPASSPSGGSRSTTASPSATGRSPSSLRPRSAKSCGGRSVAGTRCGTPATPP
jgi:hypothetical protein